MLKYHIVINTLNYWIVGDILNYCVCFHILYWVSSAFQQNTYFDCTAIPTILGFHNNPIQLFKLLHEYVVHPVVLRLVFPYKNQERNQRALKRKGIDNNNSGNHSSAFSSLYIYIYIYIYIKTGSHESKWWLHSWTRHTAQITCPSELWLGTHLVTTGLFISRDCNMHSGHVC